MRTQVVDELKKLALTGYTISNELPYDESGLALYLKNPKKIYVDRENVEILPLITTMNSADISNETTTVRAYYSIDAKQTPANYDTVIASLRGIKSTIVRAGANSREAFVTTTYEGDLMIVELEYRLTRVI
jgi:hypothetical protein